MSSYLWRKMKRLEHTFTVDTPEEFIVVYLKNIRGTLGQISGNAVKLLQLMWVDSEFSGKNKITLDGVAGNMICTTKEYKEVWGKELGLSIGAISNLITMLIKAGLLIEYHSPVYFLDPKRFFKGSSESRRKAVEVIYKFEIKEGI